MAAIDAFLRKGKLVKDPSAKNLAESYLKKARSNLVTMEILSKAEYHKDILEIPKDHSTEEWVVVSAYYSMYMAALSLLAKVGFKSRSHAATLSALEELFVKKQMLDKTQLESLKNIKLRMEEVETLRDIKDRREIAQYSVTKKATREVAERTKTDARGFVDKVEEILEEL